MPKSRQQHNSFDSSIATRVKDKITDKLGLTQKPNGEPSFAESAQGQEIRRGLNSQVAHIMPGVSSIAYGRDAINNFREIPQSNGASIIPMLLNSAAAIGLNAPFLRNLKPPKAPIKLTFYSDWGPSTVEVPTDITTNNDILTGIYAAGANYLNNAD